MQRSKIWCALQVALRGGEESYFNLCQTKTPLTETICHTTTFSLFNSYGLRFDINLFFESYLIYLLYLILIYILFNLSTISNFNIYSMKEIPSQKNYFLQIVTFFIANLFLKQIEGVQQSNNLFFSYFV